MRAPAFEMVHLLHRLLQILLHADRRRQQDAAVLDEHAREQLLDSCYLDLDDPTIAWILNHIDCFVQQSQGNTRVQQIHLRPSALNFNYTYQHCDDDDDDTDVWDKLGRAVGNLQGLERFLISTCSTRDRTYGHHVDDHRFPIPDWQRLARILSCCVPRKVSVDLYDDDDCLFLHLLENPRLCDRSAVEVASDENGEESRLANPVNHNGKKRRGDRIS